MKKKTKTTGKTKAKAKVKKSHKADYLVVTCKACHIKFVLHNNHKNTTNCGLCKSTDLSIEPWTRTLSTEKGSARA